MANNLELLVQLEVDAKQFLASLDAAKAEVNKLDTAIESAGDSKALEEQESRTKALRESTEKLNSAVAAAYAAWTVGGGMSSAILEADAATRKARASLGKMAQGFEEVDTAARDVFESAFARDITSAFDVASAASKAFATNNAEDIADISRRAISLEEVFEDGYAQQLSAAATLVKRFGVSHQEAFDFIAAGYQKNLNVGGDFLQTIEEYAVQFADASLTADQFFSAIETGAQGGALGTDKIADSIKEFRIRFNESTSSVVDGYSRLGISQAQLQAQVNNGALSIGEAFQLVRSKLLELEDQTVRNEIGAAVIGTQFEDLTATVFKEVDLQKTKLSELAGSSDEVVNSQNTLAAAFQSAASTFTSTISESDALNASFEELAAFLEDNKEEIEALAENVARLAAGLLDTTAAVGQFVVSNKEALAVILGLVGAVKALYALSLTVSAISSLGGAIVGVGASSAATAKSVLAATAALRGLSAASLGLVGLAGGVGAAVGTWIYSFDGVQESIAGVVDGIAGLFGAAPEDYVTPAVIAQREAFEKLKQEQAETGKATDELARLQSFFFDTVEEGADALEANKQAIAEQVAAAKEAAAKQAELANALETLGVTSKAELEAMAKAVSTAFETIANADVPVEQLEIAFKSYAKAALEANSGVASSQLEATAKAHGMGGALDSLTHASSKTAKAYEALGIESQAALEEQAQHAREAFDALVEGQAPLQDLQRGFEVYAKKAISANKNVASEQLTAIANTHGLTDALNKLTGKATQTADAYKTLGVTSAASLADAATKAKEAFQTLQQGGAPIRDLKSGFLAYARAAIEANGGVISSELATQAASYGVGEALSKMGESAQSGAEQAGQALEQTKQAVKEVGESAEEANEKAAKSSENAGKSVQRTSRGLRSSITWMDAVATNTVNHMSKLGETFTAVLSSKFKQMGLSVQKAGLADSFAGLKEQAEDVLSALSRMHSTKKFQDTQMKAETAALTITYEMQGIALEQLTERLKSMKSAAAGSIPTVDDLRSQFDLLDESQLSGAISEIQRLEQAAQAAEQQLASMTDSLLDELDRMSDNQQSIEQRRYEAQRERIKKLAAESGQSASEQLALAEKVHQQKLKDIEEEEAADKKRQRDRATQDTRGAAPEPKHSEQGTGGRNPTVPQPQPTGNVSTSTPQQGVATRDSTPTSGIPANVLGVIELRHKEQKVRVLADDVENLLDLLKTQADVTR